MTNNVYLCPHKSDNIGNRIMATPIRPIPVVTGDDAVRFVKAAEAAERTPHTVELEISREDFNKIMQTAQLY